MAAEHCPSEQQLVDYLLGKLSDSDSDTVENHLMTCQSCQQSSLQLHDRDDAFVRSLRRPPAVDHYANESERQEALFRSQSIVRDSMKSVTHAGDKGDPQEKSTRRRVRDYEVLKKLGEGGMGKVYLAVHRKLGKQVALKVLPPPRIVNKQAVARFKQEMKAIGRLEHPNIVRALDAGEVAGRHFLVMEFIDGQNLANLVRDRGPLSVLQAIECTIMAARGLEYAHQQGVIHRDVKPSNLLLDKTGNVKVLDLGLAHLEYEHSPADSSPSNTLTSSGQMMGSAGYMAPEQADDPHHAGRQADVYALGCTLYTLLTGTMPYAGESPLQLTRAHRERAIPSLRAARSDVSESLDKVVTKMLAKAPAERHQTMTELIAELAVCRQECAADARLAGFFRDLAGDDGPSALPLLAARGGHETYSSRADVTQVPPALMRRYRDRSRSPWVTSAVCVSVTFCVVLGVLARLVILDKDPGDKRVVQPRPILSVPIPTTLADRGGGRLVAISGSQEILLSYLDGALRAWDARGTPGPLVTPKLGPVLTFMECSADGKLLVCGSEGSPMEVWSLERSRLIAGFMPQANTVSCAAFSHAASRLATGSSDGHVTVWAVETQDSIRRTQDFTLGSQPVTCVVFSPDDTTLAAGCRDRRIRLIDLAEQSTRALPGGFDAAHALAFSSDGRLVACAGREAQVGRLQLWDVRSGEEVFTATINTGSLDAVLFPGGVDELLTGGSDGFLRVWDAKTGSERYELRAHGAPVHRLALWPDKDNVMSAGDDGQVLLWNHHVIADLPPVRGYDAVALSSTGRVVACAGPEHVVSLWDIENNALWATFPGHTDHITDLEFSRDDTMLASASADRTIRLWDVRKRNQKCPLLTAHEAEVRCLALSGKSGLLASGGADGQVMVWNAETGQQIRVLPKHTDVVTSVVFSHDDKLLASAAADRRLVIWRAETGQEVFARDDVPHAVNSIAFTRDDRSILSSGDDDVVRGWDSSTLQETRVLAGHRGPVTSSAVSPDGRIFATAALDGTVKLWDGTNGRECVTINLADSANPLGVTFAREANRLATVTTDGHVRMWDIQAISPRRTFLRPSQSVTCLAYSPSRADLVASCDAGGMVRVWNVTQRRPVVLLRHDPRQAVADLAFSHDGTTLATLGTDGTLRLWSLDRGDMVEQWSLEGETPGSQQGQRKVCWHPDGKSILFGPSSAGLIQMQDVKSGTASRSVGPSEGVVRWLAICADGSTLAVVGDNDTATIWATDAGKPEWVPDNSGEPVHLVALSRSGGSMACSTPNGAVRVWDLRSRKCLGSLGALLEDHHTGPLRALAVSPDSKFVASSGTDAKLQLWSLASRKLLHTMAGPECPVLSLAFSADGSSLAAGCEDGTIRIWDVRSLAKED